MAEGECEFLAKLTDTPSASVHNPFGFIHVSDINYHILVVHIDIR